ncbi:PaaI family thioesterase [Pseudonocardia sp. NPDC049154]|uniref:PaaI family thioesterase n=1 Tax=Pseudonocardia sp. NPDC049154 TaxID=3155501 RepID=UPI0033D99E3E
MTSEIAARVESAPLVRTNETRCGPRTRAGTPVPPGYLGLLDEVRTLLDLLGGAVPSAPLVHEATTRIAALNGALAECQVEEEAQLSGRLVEARGRGQLLIPPLVVDTVDDTSATGRVVFGRHHLGNGGAVHGGAVPLLFDELLGRLALVGGRPRSRTAFLNVDYRSVTPIDRELRVAARVDRVEGRKHFLSGTVHDGERLCAEATALFVALRPGQP